ncbi:MAG: DUF4041 domain-containing protein [Synechococcus sp.]
MSSSMSWVLVALSSGSAGALLWWALRMRGRLNQIEQKYAPALQIDRYVQEEESKINRYVREEERKIAELKEKADQELDVIYNEARSAQFQLEKNLEDLRNEYKEQKSDLLELESQLALAREETVYQNYGYYEPNYGFESSGEWEENLQHLNKEIKAMLVHVREAENTWAREKAAGYIVSVVSFNNSEAKGIKMQKASIQLLLRAFNGECDSFIAKVTYKNVSLMKKRIQASYEAINKIGQRSNMVQISRNYKELKLQELGYVYEYQEWKQREKEEQARIREQIREEERAAKELEKAKRDAEKEAKRYDDALTKARAEVEGANEKQKEKLFAQIAELEQRMKEMEEKNRYISQAMLTKSGHVYIISNIGSFGEDMLKIGMTRRLEPMDRVKELGDASVPFPFDVHAMIRTSDAPTLENALHKHFDNRRVNLENNRKEFFYVTLDEIQSELNVLKDELNIEAEIQLTMAAEAKQWRMSEAKRQHLERSYES